MSRKRGILQPGLATPKHSELCLVRGGESMQRWRVATWHSHMPAGWQHKQSGHAHGSVAVTTGCLGKAYHFKLQSLVGAALLKPITFCLVEPSPSLHTSLPWIGRHRSPPRNARRVPPHSAEFLNTSTGALAVWIRVMSCSGTADSWPLGSRYASMCTFSVTSSAFSSLSSRSWCIEGFGMPSICASWHIFASRRVCCKCARAAATSASRGAAPPAAPPAVMVASASASPRNGCTTFCMRKRSISVAPARCASTMALSCTLRDVGIVFADVALTMSMGVAKRLMHATVTEPSTAELSSVAADSCWLASTTTSALMARTKPSIVATSWACTRHQAVIREGKRRVGWQSSALQCRGYMFGWCL
eukprot:351327-Chlamydomonas_euryale.AAC.6